MCATENMTNDDEQSAINRERGLEEYLSNKYKPVTSDGVDGIIRLRSELKIRDFDIYLAVSYDVEYKWDGIYRDDGDIYTSENKTTYEWLTERQALERYGLNKAELSELAIKLKHDDPNCQMCIYGLFEGYYCGDHLCITDHESVLKYSKVKKHIELYKRANPRMFV